MKKYCSFPFMRFTIEWDGNVSFCCPAYNNNYFIGNIFKDSFEDMWYGEKATEFRKSILDGSYKYCNLDICGEWHEFCRFNKEDYPKDENFLHPPFPQTVNLSYVRSCNVRCKTCRDVLDVETKEQTKCFDEVADKIVHICKNADLIYLNGGGELFTSNHLKHVVNKLTDTYPLLEFQVHSNGLLFDEKHIKDFGLENKIHRIEISVHAATKKTYEKIVRGGHWKQIIKNLKYLSKISKEQDIDFTLIFVAHSLNYKEMPKFVKLGNKLGARVAFWKYRNWPNTKMGEEYERYTCWDPTHPEYKKFIKVLRRLKTMHGYRMDEGYLRELQNSLDYLWWQKILNFFKRKNKKEV